MGLFALSLLGLSLFLSLALIWFGAQYSHVEKEKMVSLDQLVEEIEENSKQYPYISKAPKVTEVFSWLSSHPLLEELKKENDPIELRELELQLVESPSQIKAEIEFAFKSMMSARKFHEALREGDDFVDPNLEITWDVLNDGYRASFYLKNRSP